MVTNELPSGLMRPQFGLEIEGYRKHGSKMTPFSDG